LRRGLRAGIAPAAIMLAGGEAFAGVCVGIASLHVAIRMPLVNTSRKLNNPLKSIMLFP